MNEIEIRGKISPTRFKELKILLEKSGRLLKHYHRLSVDVSPGFDEKTRTWNNPSGLDLRVKKSDNEEKISLKIGHFYEKERSEIDVALVPGEFLNAITLLDSLGYSKGMVYFWESWEFEYKGSEIKLSKYSDAYYIWEIESKNTSDPDVLAVELNLTPFTKEENTRSNDWENINLHKLYSKKLVLALLQKVDIF
ncbi:hypothetical protein A3H26_02415 [candidate division WWE3 bacterium RIFCSPLOWO2_12_FULL_36_10]|uniref:CYTH domain-containing protein n=1 Tax=candidate division WWE3 bacterium RIFCSPLOWO2_12_FULL_36_10 TaxID=1802630 RepID=A0A1F4VJL7_UNCKA|nr:MAG: hypothetical protein A3H26_02415 [candidate division WWE3 bacterium RIFCSPLOWO2_12_FULL_36_10]